MNLCLPSDLYIVTTDVFLFVQGPDMNNLCCIHAASKRGRDCLHVHNSVHCFPGSSVGHFLYVPVQWNWGLGWCHPPGVPFTPPSVFPASPYLLLLPVLWRHFRTWWHFSPTPVHLLFFIFLTPTLPAPLWEILDSGPHSYTICRYSGFSLISLLSKAMLLPRQSPWGSEGALKGDGSLKEAPLTWGGVWGGSWLSLRWRPRSLYFSWARRAFFIGVYGELFQGSWSQLCVCVCVLLLHWSLWV